MQQNPNTIKEKNVLELGSGAGFLGKLNYFTKGIACAKLGLCREIHLTECDIVLKRLQENVFSSEFLVH